MFNEKIKSLFNDIGTHKNMVLSTSFNNIIHSRMMSVICFDNKFYFQTDRNFRKYKDIKFNQNISLCIDNIQIEGIAKEIGCPKDNKTFCKLFKNAFQKPYELYTGLENEVLFEVIPTNIYRWIYENGKPYTEHFNIKKQSYKINEYTVK